MMKTNERAKDAEEKENLRWRKKDQAVKRREDNKLKFKVQILYYYQYWIGGREE